ncbi:MAG: hypothetical protein ACI4IJ_03155 [Acutalibacteraceae bacterium]
MRKKYNKTKLRAALLSLLTIALLAATAAFIGTSAAEAVSDSDLAASGSDISSTDITALADEIPADLGEPKIVMTTSKAVGEKLLCDVFGYGDYYVDLGDGRPVLNGGDNIIKGDTIKIYVDTSKLDKDDEYYDLKTGGISFFCCSSESITSIDTSNAGDALWFFECHDNLLTELDFTNNSRLGEVYINNNQLVSIKLPTFDVDNMVPIDNTDQSILGPHGYGISILDVENNNLTSLDLSNTCVSNLDCSYNNLTSLIFNQTSASLGSLCCSNNQLTSLDLSSQSELEILECQNNALKYSTIKLPKPEDRINLDMCLCEVLTENQATVNISSSIKAGKTIDLSSEYETTDEYVYNLKGDKRTGAKTVYKWFDSSDNEVTPTKSENGVFTFGDEFVGKTLYCTMTNALYPDLTLKTTTVEILEADLIVEDNVGIVEDVEPSDGIIIRDKDGNIVDLNGVKLIVGNIETNKKKTVLEAIERYNKEFKADSTDCALYDISLVDGNGAKVYIEDGGRIKIKLKYPDNLGRESEDYTYHLYHQKDDGSIEEIAIHCEPNGIWFYADEFSPYVITWSLKQSGGTDVENGPGTGESIALTIVASCLALLSLAAIGTVVYRKKFARSAK